MSPDERIDDQTSPSLIRSVQANDSEAWRRMVAWCHTLVLHWCRREGLSPEDAEDVAQEVFRTVATNLGKFEHGRNNGTFRGWLRVITQSRISDFRRRKSNRLRGVGGSTAHGVLQNTADPGDNSADSIAESPHLRHVRAAFEELKNQTDPEVWRVFELTQEGRSPKEIAEHLPNWTPERIYTANHRTRQRFRKLLDREPSTEL